MTDAEIKHTLGLAKRYVLGRFPALAGEHEDVAQEVTMRLHVRGDDVSSALLFTCVRNECIDRMRRHRPAAPLDTVDGHWDGLEDQVRARLQFREAMEVALPPHQARGRVAALLGLTESQLAQAAGTSLPAAKQSIFKAKRRLRGEVDG